MELLQRGPGSQGSGASEGSFTSPLHVIQLSAWDRLVVCDLYLRVWPRRLPGRGGTQAMGPCKGS